ncbi:MAG: sulfurtransferase [Magnetococcales bacterium]|nr:sulfurtransferase [Magnetococcales bacterium]
MNATKGERFKDRESMGFVEAEWLESTLRDPDLCIVQLDGEKYYHQFHIPGAVQLSYGKLVTKRDDVPGMLADPAELAREFGRMGIGVRTPVVAYDLTGGLDAARLLWTLATAGHTGFKGVLDGGLADWYSRDRPMESGTVRVRETSFDWRLERRWLAESEEVLAVSEGRRDGLLVDTRSAKEYQGLTIRSPRGHIRGAVLYEWTDSLRGPRDFLLKDRGEIERQLARIGVTDREKELIVYCETAHRAAHTWLLLTYLGYEKVRLYDGSIAQWRVLGLPVTVD